MVRLTLILYGRPVIRTKLLTRDEALARIRKWDRVFYRVYDISTETEVA